MSSTQFPGGTQHLTKQEMTEVMALLKQVAKGDGIARVARDRLDRIRNRAIKRKSREVGE